MKSEIDYTETKYERAEARATDRYYAVKRTSGNHEKPWCVMVGAIPAPFIGTKAQCEQVVLLLREAFMDGALTT